MSYLPLYSHALLVAAAAAESSARHAGHADSFEAERIARLEQRVAALAAENGTLAASLDAEQQAHAADVAELQRRLSEDVQQMVQRQEQVRHGS